MRSIYVILGTLLVVIGVFAGGYYLGQGQIEIQQVVLGRKTKTVVVEVVKERIVVKKPDGTTETTEREVTREETKREQETKREVVHTQPTEAKPNFSVGALYRLDYNDLVGHNAELEITAGYRLFGDLWLQGIGSKSDIAVGIRVEF